MKTSELSDAKKGILLLRNINPKTNFFLVKKFLQIFGKINKIFFTKISFKKKNRKEFFHLTEIVGWVEYFYKFEAKKVTAINSVHYKYLGNQNKKVKLIYLKNFKWENLKFLMKKKS